MIYLTGQLLFFLLVTAFLGFIVGWLLRGAMLPISMLESNEIRYISSDSRSESSNYQLINNSMTGTFKEPEHAES